MRAALIAKAHAVKIGEANELAVWGSGSPLREFMYVDDLYASGEGRG